MTTFAKTMLSSHAADSIARVFSANPLVRSGAAALAARWAMRSVPAAVTLVGIGALARHYMDRKRKSAASATAQRATRKPKAKTSRSSKAATA